MKVVGSRKVWSLEEVTGAVALRFEDIRAFWVEAEIDDVRAVGGQVYFSLRGGHVVDASMRAVVFDRVAPRPTAGTLVHAHGRMEYHRPRSRVSMRVEVLELAGEGLLKARIDELRRRLAAEGLLRAGRERPLPLLPRRVALVTSAVGAARDDFLRNAWARFPELDVLAVHTPVQGEAAPGLIARAIRGAGAQPGVDVVVVTRGGGSLEDLMAFNSEPVCRAVAACPVPVVSAVGHERDLTLCDEVADVRVSTPTGAAVAVVPSREALVVRLSDAGDAMARAVGRTEAEARAALARAEGALGRGLGATARGARGRLSSARERLAPAARRALGECERRAGEREGRAARATVRCAERASDRIDRASALLRSLSPRRTLARGYAIVRERESGNVVVDAATLGVRRRIEIELRDGRVAARVEETHER